MTDLRSRLKALERRVQPEADARRAERILREIDEGRLRACPYRRAYEEEHGELPPFGVSCPPGCVPGRRLCRPRDDSGERPHTIVEAIDRGRQVALAATPAAAGGPMC